MLAVASSKWKTGEEKKLPSHRDAARTWTGVGIKSIFDGECKRESLSS